MPAKKQSRRKLPDIYELHIELVGINPAIWRQVLVPDGCSLAVLHSVVQESFGWQDYHLFRFEYQDREFERPDVESSAENAEKVTLKSLALTPGSSLRYIYDFGDDWEHAIRFVGVRPLQLDRLYPYCVDGARAGPPEDCGGPPGYERLLEILADPTHPEFLEMRAWTGSHFHPETFDLRATNRILMLAFE
jgi:Plasmid pRiA4b ORF-3-like protein